MVWWQCWKTCTKLRAACLMFCVYLLFVGLFLSCVYRFIILPYIMTHQIINTAYQFLETPEVR